MRRHPARRIVEYFYPRSPCGERPRHNLCPRKGKNFYPRSPCGERRHNRQGLGQIVQFLSTLSLRRATSRHNLCPRKGKNFYPRSPCGERHADRKPDEPAICISIHALLAESDIFLARRSTARLKFLSTLSLRRATYGWVDAAAITGISIHALLAESDTLTGARA